MFVESIELNNYRNFDSLKVEFSPGVNIFFGDNAQGKTNQRGFRQSDNYCF